MLLPGRPRRICSSRFSRPLLWSQDGRVGTDSLLAEVVPLRVGNVAIQPFESSAPNPAVADFGPSAEIDAGEKNGQERAKGRREWAKWPTSEVRRFPQEPAQTCGNCCYRPRKSPN